MPHKTYCCQVGHIST